MRETCGSGERRRSLRPDQRRQGPGRRCARRARPLSTSEDDRDDLLLRIREDSAPAELTSDAAALHAPPGQRRVHRSPAVDPYGPGTDLARHRVRRGDIARPDRRREPVDRVVRHRDGLLDRVERHHGADRAEDLLAGDGRGVVDVSEDGWFDEEPGPVNAPAARDEPGSLGLALLDVGQDPLLVRHVHQRAHRGGLIQWVAENLRPGGLAERLDDRVVERAADQDPRTSGAHFSLVEEEPHRDALDRRLCICVGEDDLRALRPSSRTTRLNVSAAAFWIVRPTSGEPVKLILSTPGCATSAAPATSPSPGTTLTVPAGNPLSCPGAPHHDGPRPSRPRRTATAFLLHSDRHIQPEQEEEPQRANGSVLNRHDTPPAVRPPHHQPGHDLDLDPTFRPAANSAHELAAQTYDTPPRSPTATKATCRTKPISGLIVSVRVVGGVGQAACARYSTARPVASTPSTDRSTRSGRCGCSRAPRYPPSSPPSPHTSPTVQFGAMSPVVTGRAGCRWRLR